MITLLGSFFLATACSSDEPSEIAEPTAAAEDQAASGKSMTDIAAEHITDEYIREVMIEISSDEYEGRGPSTAGDTKTREYLAKQMGEIGLVPAAQDGAWEQPFDMVSVNTLPPEGWTFEGHGKTVSFEFYEDFMINGDNQHPNPGF